MSANNIVQHEVGNTIIITGKKGEPNKETLMLGASMVSVGAKTGNQTIQTDKETGLKYQTDEIQAKVLYKLSEQKRSTWFAIDLETGGRGWYPGCISWGVVEKADVKAYDDDLSETLITVSDSQIQILDVLDNLPRQWYKARYNDIVGYVKKSAVTNIIYKNPN